MTRFHLVPVVASLVAQACGWGGLETRAVDAGLRDAEPDLVDVGVDPDASDDATSDGGGASDGAPVDASTSMDASSAPDVGDTCGDGEVGLTEECDDGNMLGGDGCEEGCVSTFGAFEMARYAPDAPVNLTRNVVESLEVLLIPERVNHLLESDVNLDVAVDGEFDSRTDHGAVLRAGARVHVYLIHFDPPTAGDVTLARIHFARPVLGVVTTEAGLMATDWLARPGAMFSNPSRGLDIEDSGALVDGTLELRLLGNRRVDQLRVFTATLAAHDIVVEIP